ncbi:unnamed protein product [Protopolystoma xenopodis]|uniref:Uncharacterized protein n=1 Tax=Protopolystoma xenopodis TaxID=117903 RepID=A0A448X1N4_9PLAT|nr:unnamed protein product [Protopolystoma xenopodis]
MTSMESCENLTSRSLKSFTFCPVPDYPIKGEQGVSDGSLTQLRQVSYESRVSLDRVVNIRANPLASFLNKEDFFSIHSIKERSHSPNSLGMEGPHGDLDSDLDNRTKMCYLLKKSPTSVFLGEQSYSANPPVAPNAISKLSLSDAQSESCTFSPELLPIHKAPMSSCSNPVPISSIDVTLPATSAADFDSLKEDHKRSIDETNSRSNSNGSPLSPFLVSGKSVNFTNAHASIHSVASSLNTESSHSLRQNYTEMNSSTESDEFERFLSSQKKKNVSRLSLSLSSSFIVSTNSSSSNELSSSFPIYNRVDNKR